MRVALQLWNSNAGERDNENESDFDSKHTNNEGMEQIDSGRRRISARLAFPGHMDG
jgi:hypothetical protein